MNFERYDKFLWRLIGTLILVGVIGGAVLTAITLFSRSDKTTDVVSAGSSNDEKVPFNFQSAYALEQTEFVLLEVSNRNVDKTYIKGHYGQVTNIMLINTRTMERRWLLEHSDRNVSTTRVHQDDDKSKKVLGLLLEIQDSPTSETRSLKYFDLATMRLNPIALGIHKLISSVMDPHNILLVFFTKNNNAFYMTYDLQSAAVKEHAVTAPPL